MMSDHHYFIEPLKGHVIEQGKPHPHLLYKTAHNTKLTEDETRQAHDDHKPDEYCSSHKTG